MNNKNFYCGVVNVASIVEQHLRNNGFDGLFYEGECGCHLKDLFPCGENGLQCTPGYKKLTIDGWIIGPDKPDNPPPQGEKEE